MKVRPTLTLPLGNRGELLEAFFHHGSFSGLFVNQELLPAGAHFEPGTDLDLHVSLPEQQSFRFRGRVLWQREPGEPGPAGLAVTFQPGERSTRDLLLDYAKGRTITMVERSAERVPLMVQVQYRTASTLLSDLTGDVSEGGAFITSESPPAVGSVVVLRLCPAGDAEPLDVLAEVTWSQTTGRTGFGVKFIYENEQARREMARMVDQAREVIRARFGVPEELHALAMQTTGEAPFEA